jgi:hypothetical protein
VKQQFAQWYRTPRVVVVDWVGSSPLCAIFPFLSPFFFSSKNVCPTKICVFNITGQHFGKKKNVSGLFTF